jgi:SOS-response transcriptional repressor LexA
LVRAAVLGAEYGQEGVMGEYHARRRLLGYREHQVLAFTRSVIEEQGVAPSYGMICDELGINTRGEVSRIVAGLERKGILRRAGVKRVRRIRLVNAN